MPTIAALPAATSVTDDDLIPISQVNSDDSITLRRASVEQIVGNPILYGTTLSNTPLRLTQDGDSAGSSNIANMTPNSVRMVVIQVLARDTVTGDIAAFISSPSGNEAGFPVIVKVGSTIGTIQFLGTPIFNQTQNTGGGSLTGISAPSLTVDTIYGGLNITVTANGSNSVHWKAKITYLEV